MIYKAYLSDTKKFLSLPETGMGYQIFEAKKFGEPYKNKFVVYNVQLVIDLDDKFIEFKRQAFTKGFSNILNESEGLPVDTDTISLLPKNLILESRFLSESKKSNKKRHSGEKGAIDNPKESADGKEIFVRLSAYEDDKRIDAVNNRLKEGAYTTILSDYFDCVNTQDDPVDRYASPNDEIIKWTFYLKPKYGDILQRGIVQPAFGHDGGGIEAYFEYGTSNNTYFDKKVYGE